MIEPAVVAAVRDGADPHVHHRHTDRFDVLEAVAPARSGFDRAPASPEQ